jgi:hypothetical protein
MARAPFFLFSGHGGGNPTDYAAYFRGGAGGAGYTGLFCSKPFFWILSSFLNLNLLFFFFQTPQDAVETAIGMEEVMASIE